MNVIHVSPTYYSTASVIGGGEKYIIYMMRALARGAERAGSQLKNAILAYGNAPGASWLEEDIQCDILPGMPWNPFSICPQQLLAKIESADTVIVHQCLSAFGLFVASHARLAGKIVVGMDHGGGEHPLVSRTPEIGHIFNCFIAQSKFAASSFLDIDAPVKTILGPIDTGVYAPDRMEARDPRLVLAVGRLLPHKGFDRIIQALPGTLRMVIAGTRANPEYFEYLKSLIRASGSDIRIKEGLADEQIRALMRNAGLFVHASTHTDYKGENYAKPELLGLAPLEAMASGAPALVSAAGSLSEMSSVIGCQVFSSDKELAVKMKAHADGVMKWPSAEDIHDAVTDLYGLESFGDQIFRELGCLGNTR